MTDSRKLVAAIIVFFLSSGINNWKQLKLVHVDRVYRILETSEWYRWGRGWADMNAFDMF